MSLYIIGLGLNKEGISQEGMDAVKRCKTIYLESYTVDFPYNEVELEEILGKKVILADRDMVEGLSFVDEAARSNVALLVYGSPLTATTHITIIEECKTCKVKCKVIYGASVFDGILQTGLQFYKFGKVASMPAWKKSFEPTSFLDIVKQNRTIDAHSLILIDIGLDFPEAMEQLRIASEKEDVKIDEIVLCQAMGTDNAKMFYGKLEAFEGFTSVRKPYCMIVPGKLHFVEKEVLERLRI